MINSNHFNLDKSQIERAFNRAASSYDGAAVLQKEVGERLFERLTMIRLQPEVIVDLGSGTGQGTRLLAAQFPNAKVIAIDLAYKMLLQQRNKYDDNLHEPDQHQVRQQNFEQSVFRICADIETMPLQANSVDIIYSNMTLHWCSQLPLVLQHVRRVLKPDGLFIFSMLGRDTFYELHHSWAQVDNKTHVHDFADMHEIGDMLVNAQFADPVMDMEYITLHYKHLNDFFADLKGAGVSNLMTARPQGLQGKRAFNQFVQNYEQLRNSNGLLPATYEIIYGHARHPLMVGAFANELGEAHIAIHDIGYK